MKPLIDLPSAGTVNAHIAGRMRAALMILSPLVSVVWIILSPLLVPIVAAWRKSPASRWRTFVILSIVAAVVLAVMFRLTFGRDGMPIRFPQAVGLELHGTVWGWCIEAMNTLLIAAVAFLPLSMASTIDTIANRRKAST